MEPDTKPYMDKQLMEEQMRKMQQKYGDKTLLYLTGNYHADKQCLQNSCNVWHSVNLKASVLPRFVVLHNASKEVATSSFNHFIKFKQKEQRISEFLKDHPEAEETRLNPEIGWKASIWPISNKNKHWDPKEN